MRGCWRGRGAVVGFVGGSGLSGDRLRPDARGRGGLVRRRRCLVRRAAGRRWGRGGPAGRPAGLRRREDRQDGRARSAVRGRPRRRLAGAGGRRAVRGERYKLARGRRGRWGHGRPRPLCAVPGVRGGARGVAGLGEVTTDTVGGEDVTEEFVDLESRERNLLAAEDGLLGLYGEVESVDDALAIERELTDLRGQIETVQGRIQFLEDRATTSRIALGIQPVRGPATPEPALEPVRAVAAAWEASLAFLGTVAGAVISVVVFGWWLLPALVAASVWWRRRTRRASPAEGP
ncbi:DUF4349 domain-containing protein [Rubrobacter marinus]|uniref:DUF4349 domain-containing protein n=1 Tax=Rubrobacter marinus TaxID=2653852 RepID=A0A6G8PXH2_9ACTN|nr:DUF4349 domain-containing protein [Rubrobacter marinus]